MPDPTNSSPTPLPVALERPVAFLDIESTGLSIAQDRIVELAVLIVHPDGSTVERVRRFNPEMPIPKGASDVHGITDEEVRDEAPFRQRARALAALLDPCDLAGFNIRRFDLPMLAAEFRRVGVPFDMTARRLLDAQLIFHREEPRDLAAAVRFYLGEEMVDAHSALADIRASADVFWAQLRRYKHLPPNLDGIQSYLDEIAPYRTELDRWFDRKRDGLVFRRGKHAGTSLMEVAESAPDYLQWMLGADEMDPEVLEVVREALFGPAVDPDQVTIPLAEDDLAM